MSGVCIGRVIALCSFVGMTALACNEPLPKPMQPGLGSGAATSAADSTGTTDASAESSTTEDDSPTSDTTTASSAEESSTGDTTNESIPCQQAWQNTDCETPGEWSGAGECNPFVNDCNPGLKCWPYNPLGPETRCVPISSRRLGLDETCVREEVDGEYRDDCDYGLYCQVGTDPPNGKCAELCGCGPDDRTCPADYTCVSSPFASQINLHRCRRACDPLGEDCPPDESCYPVASVGEIRGFACFPPGQEADGAPCPDGYGCGDDLICNDGVCSAPCHLDMTDSCPGDQTCMPFVPGEGNATPLCLSHVGTCL